MRRLRHAIIAAVLAAIALTAAAVAAVPGALDTGFNPNVDGWVVDSALQADGKIVIGGSFTGIGNDGSGQVARLNSDGTRDGAFAGPGVDTSQINPVAVQADGKVLIGGDFTCVGSSTSPCPPGNLRNRVARLNADGTLDDAFDPNVNGSVHSIRVHGDGKILIGGDFTCVGSSTSSCPPGNVRNRVARLNADGTLDTSFNPNADGRVSSIALQGDGKVLIGGDFDRVGGEDRSKVARLNADGTLDTGFVGPLANHPVYSVAVQSDGKVLIGGDFWEVGEEDRRGVARLNASGTLDTGFVDPVISSPFPPGLRDTVLQADGKILIGGYFTCVGSSTSPCPPGNVRNYVARLNPDGSLDSEFNPGVHLLDPSLGDGAVLTVALQDDGKVLIGGGFPQVGGETRHNAARLLGTTPQVAPRDVSAAAGAEQATVTWTGVLGQISSYTVTASPGGRTCMTAGSSCTVTGLAAGTSYTFTVAAANGFGSGPASSASNAVTPLPGSSGSSSPATPSGKPADAPRPLRASVSRGPDGSPLTTGRVPAGATRVMQGATLLGAPPRARGMWSEMARTRLIRCPITTRGAVRTFRCAPRLAAGRWRLTTRAMAGSTVIAMHVQVVRVTPRAPARGAGVAVTG